MSIQRSQLIRGPAYFSYNGANFFTETDIIEDIEPVYEDVNTSMFGPVDQVKTDLVIKHKARLWGAWENLSILFPSYLLNPIPGTSIFGNSDVALTIQAYNGDTFAINNAAVTGMANLYLGTDKKLFAADVEFTGLIANNTNPETASSYTTRGTNAYAAATAAFAKTNYKRVRFSAAWGAITGFTAIQAQQGWSINWLTKTDPFKQDGFGTVDMSIKSTIVEASCIPVGPTQAQIKANSLEESAMGTLGSSGAADLTITGNGGSPVIVLKSAFIKKGRTVFGSNDLRVNQTTWSTTRIFSSGAPAVTASVA